MSPPIRWARKFPIPRRRSTPRGKTRRTRLGRPGGRRLCWPASRPRRSTRSEGRSPQCCQTQRKTSERPTGSGGRGSDGLARPARAAAGWRDPFGSKVGTSSPGRERPFGSCDRYEIEQQAPLTRMRMQPLGRPADGRERVWTGQLERLLAPEPAPPSLSHGHNRKNIP